MSARSLNYVPLSLYVYVRLTLRGETAIEISAGGPEVARESDPRAEWKTYLHASAPRIISVQLVLRSCARRGSAEIRRDRRLV